MKKMTFGDAIQALKDGKRVTRQRMERKRNVPLVKTRNNYQSRLV